MNASLQPMRLPFSTSYIAALAFCALLSFGASAQNTSDALKTCVEATSPKRAVEACTAAVNLNVLNGTDLANVYFHRANANKTLGLYKSAVRDFNEAIALDNSRSDLFLGRGLTYQAMRSFEHAIKDYDAALMLRPDHAAAYNARGSVYRQLGEVGKAIHDYTESIRYDGNYGIAYYNRCFALALIGQNDAALADCSWALILKPNISLAYVYDARAYVHFRQKKYDRAIDDYNAALRIDPRLARALFGRGIVHRALGDTKASNADLAAAKAARPDIDEEMKQWGRKFQH